MAELDEAQQRVLDHEEGPLLVLGVAGSGRTEALSRRLATLAAAGTRALVLTCSQAAVTRIRTRAEETVETAFEELEVHTHQAAAAARDPGQRGRPAGPHRRSDRRAQVRRGDGGALPRLGGGAGARRGG